MSQFHASLFSHWSTGRKAAAVLFAVGGYVLLACMTLYLSGALFLVLNKVDPSRARLLSIVRYWQAYADDPALRKKLQISLGLPAVGLLIVLPASLITAARPRRSLHGDARFATKAEVVRSGLLFGKQPCILVGRYGEHYLSLGGQLSVLVAAPTRSGKGHGLVIPNLLHWPDSAVILDLKNENYRITAGYRETCGSVYRFSPYDDRSHRWNPLGAVRKHPRHRTGDLLAIAHIFYPEDGGGTQADAFFNSQARNMFLGLGLMLLESPKLPCTIGEMLRQASGQGQLARDHIAGLIAQRRAGNQPLSSACEAALHRLLSNSENTLASIIASFSAPLLAFADATVDAATSASDFDLQHVRRRRMSIYVQIPASRLSTARPLLNLLFSQLVNLNTDKLPEDDPSLQFQCLLVNDEFTVMGRANALVDAAAILAGYNLRLLTAVQAMSQLDAVYGEKVARTFTTNHAVQVLYSTREQRDAEEYSEMLGYFTQQATSRGRSHSFSAHGHSSVSSNDSDQRRALLLPQEFRELDAKVEVVVMAGCKPILGQKIRYYDRRELKERVVAPPPVPRLPLPEGSGHDVDVARGDTRSDATPGGGNLVERIGATLKGALSRLRSDDRGPSLDIDRS